MGKLRPSKRRVIMCLNYLNSDNGKTARAVYVNPLASDPNSDTGTEAQYESFAHAEIIVRDGEVHVLTVSSENEMSEPVVTCKASCLGMSLEDLREAQGKDPDLQFILEWLRSSAIPPEGDLFLYFYIVMSRAVSKSVYDTMRFLRRMVPRVLCERYGYRGPTYR